MDTMLKTLIGQTYDGMLQNSLSYFSSSMLVKSEASAKRVISLAAASSYSVVIWIVRERTLPFVVKFTAQYPHLLNTHRSTTDCLQIIYILRNTVDIYAV